MSTPESGAPDTAPLVGFEAAIRATQGARSYQEDTALTWPPAPGQLHLPPFSPAGQKADGTLAAVLADGMGGHAGGALASRMACEQFLASVLREGGPNSRRLLAALEAANRAIARKVDANPALFGMGATLVGVLFAPGGIEWLSVGDSPLLLFRDSEIAHLNEDHSLAPELDRLAALGTITAEEAREDPRRHMLRSAVTGEEIDLVDVSRRPLVLRPGDYVILASDGVHTLDDGEIARVIAAYAADGAEAVAEALIRAVESVRDPHQDNATVVAVRAVPS